MKKTNITKELIDLNEAPPLESNKIYYNCSECPSIIEIISIDEDNIKFKCNNNHKKEMKIKDYLSKMKKYNDIKLIANNCNIHKEDYLAFCFDCKIHICKECLKSGKHSYHYKIFLIEITPNNESLNQIRNLIKDNKTKIQKFNKTKINVENKFKDILENSMNKIKDKIEIEI